MRRSSGSRKPLEITAFEPDRLYVGPDSNRRKKYSPATLAVRFFKRSNQVCSTAVRVGARYRTCVGPDSNRRKKCSLAALAARSFHGSNQVCSPAARDGARGRTCVGPDSNRRTSTGQRPQRCAVGLAWLPTPGRRTARTARSRSDLTLSVPYPRASRPVVPGFLYAPRPTGLPHPQTDNMRPGYRPRCPPIISPLEDPAVARLERGVEVRCS